MFNNQTELQTFYHDEMKTFINYSITGIDKIHQGMEIGAELKASSSITLNGAFSIGNYRYTSRPNANISAENGMFNDSNQLVYQKGFYLEGAPITGATAGIRWSAPKFWYLNANINYWGDRYLDFMPARRTETALQNMLPNDPIIKEITAQEKVKGGYTIDLSVGKSIRINYKYYINFNFGVSNILDKKDLITNGFEQLRFDYATKNTSKFPPKYYYMIGRNYFINVAFRF